MILTFQKTRLAPSPTGALHLGHARTFLVSWWLARQAGARVLMRMEDLDASRAKPQSVQQAYDDLHWLGMDWDPAAETQDSRREIQISKLETRNSKLDPVVQSQRMHLYREVLERLWRMRAVYPCTCSRADIAASVAGAASAPHAGEATGRYPGTCRANTLGAAHQTQNTAEIAASLHGQSGKPVCWRLCVEPGEMMFEDLIAGTQSFDVYADVGDFPLTRFDGTPAYQLACVVDDHALGIDLVVRGDDLLSSTPRQMALYQTLGWQPPQFAHVPLVVGPDGKRLAKRHGESRIAQFRTAGVTPQRIVGWAAWRSGQLDQPREISAAEMTAHFDLAKLPPEPVVLEPKDLAWLR